MRINASGGTPQHHQNESSGKKQFGIFVGKVKENVDKSGLGRLRVWIPQLSSAQEDDQEGWFTMRYCPPFAGASDTSKESTARDANSFPDSNQSYGFWMVPPTKDVNVVCGFINGETTQGIWWACLPHDGHTHSLPGVASGSTHDGKIKPVGERNRYNTADAQIDNRPEHPQSFKLSQQGLDKDLRRGHTNAGPFRSKENHPGLAYGILTPGQHSLMLDDGEDGVSGQVRLRTASGHQIVMHEEGGFIHIINAKGTAWIELDEEGNIDFYAGGNFSVHAEKNINLYAGNNINFDAENNINGVGRNDVRLEACEEFNVTGTNGVNITSNLNMDIKAAASLKETATRIDLNGPVAKSATMPEEHSLVVNQYIGRSVAARVPEHEPWAGHGKFTGGEKIATPVGVEDPTLGNPEITPAPESYEEAKPETPEEQALASDCLSLDNLDSITMSSDGFDLLIARSTYKSIMYADGDGYSVGYGTRIDLFGPANANSKLDASLKKALLAGPSEAEARLALRQIIDRHTVPVVRSELKQSLSGKSMCLTQAMFDSLCLSAYSNPASATTVAKSLVESAAKSNDGKPLPEDVAKIWANASYVGDSDQKNAVVQYALSGSVPSSFKSKTLEKNLSDSLAQEKNAMLNNKISNPAFPWAEKFGQGDWNKILNTSPGELLKNRLQSRGTTVMTPEEAAKFKSRDAVLGKPNAEQLSQWERSYYLNTGKPAPGTNLTLQQLKAKYGSAHLGGNIPPNAPTF